MTALIDNYSTIECVTETPPRSLNVRYITEIYPRSLNVRYITDIYSSVMSSTIFSCQSEFKKNQRIHNLLDEFALLKDNWDEEDALAPSDIALLKSRYLVSLLDKQGQSIFHTAPGPNGEIMLDIRNNKKNRSLEVIFYSDRAVSVLFPDEGKAIQQSFNFGQLPNLLHWLNQK